jgi:hypothetical protein
VAGYCVHGNEHLVYIKYLKFLEYIKNYQLVEKDSGPWRQKVPPKIL